ncbi:MAG: phenylalanine--tRNA ligase subunit beta [Desulfuromonas sp.]|nr:MAG: phenylalanine--tRNA ligase subunit beta [Desulfuromonas sp.]
MNVTLNWLREFVKVDLPTEDLSHRLTMAGLEVEAVEEVGAGLDSVIVARLESVESHPDADRLTVCQVLTGVETVQVVCGATNHRSGDLVALAQVGTVLPGEFKIKKSKIRGQVSQGMLCSEKELGLSEESAGIMILEGELELGAPVFDALGLKDVRFEIGLTPNRPDCLSVRGVAREVAAMTGQRLESPDTALLEEGGAIEADTSVVIETSEVCPRYAARLIKNVKIGPSPGWVVRRLEAVGIRSINNVVDVTNLMMIELGHPLHAFDFNLLRDKRIVVRCAGENEMFITLDGQQRTLQPSDVVICDGEGPVALGGIMGGENSEIQDDTTDVLLEAAYFDPNTIRRTSKRLGIHTESSHRFERGADVDMIPYVIDRAASLICELAGGKVSRGMVDVYPEILASKQVEISVRKTEATLGLGIPADEIKRLLTSIDLELAKEDGGQLLFTIPAFRPDLEREIDLIEEVARLKGYDQIPVTMPESRLICHRPDKRQQLVTTCRDFMVSVGYHEVVNYSFVSPTSWDSLLLPPDDARRDCVPLLNPLNEEQSIMRTTLVGSMLETVARNLSYRSLDLRLFELRPTFKKQQETVLADEGYRLTAVLTGRRFPLGWAQQDENSDLFDIKGVAETLLKVIGTTTVDWLQDGKEPYLHPGKSCRLMLDDIMIGQLGEVHPAVLDSYGIEQPVFLFDLDLQVFQDRELADPGFQAISRFPDVFRDTAILIDDEMTSEQVLAVVEQAKGAYAEEVVLFDLYRGKGIPEGKKSLAFRVRYRAADRTLTDDEINKAHDRIVRALDHKLGAVQR